MNITKKKKSNFTHGMKTRSGTETVTSTVISLSFRFELKVVFFRKISNQVTHYSK